MAKKTEKKEEKEKKTKAKAVKKGKSAEKEKKATLETKAVEEKKATEVQVPKEDEKIEVVVEEARSSKSEFIGVAHVYSSKNNTIITVTDMSGAETLASASGGMVVKSGREERTPFAAIQIAKIVAEKIKDKGMRKIDILLRGKGGHAGQKSPGRAASAVIKGFARAGVKIRRIEDVTPIPHGGCKPPGGKRGRRV
ncbi:MAG: 30S ribosomal protein S11 [Candidatus Altiarchaeota archaeon]|nr:30S ribosomal protein S11 [Candidatus Altiarchaeota archaeon]